MSDYLGNPIANAYMNHGDHVRAMAKLLRQARPYLQAQRDELQVQFDQTDDGSHYQALQKLEALLQEMDRRGL